MRHRPALIIRWWRVLGLCWLLLVPAVDARDGSGGYAVASAHPLATAAGIDMLQRGGNAFDAAVAVAFSLAVVEPTGSGLGGGGFWLLDPASGAAPSMIDGREMAPQLASADMFLDAQGQLQRSLALSGALAAAIPGSPRALQLLAHSRGRLPWATLLEPAIRQAEQGFACDGVLAAHFAENWSRFSPAARAVYAIDGRAPRSGERIVQPDLARTLRLLARDGADAFYAGALADRLVAGVRANGGIWQMQDLRDYRVVEREALSFDFFGNRVLTAPPPSAGGIALIQILGQLQQLDLDAGEVTPHLLIEAMRRAYRDRAQWLGDPDYVDVPVRELSSAAYLQALAASISPSRATPSRELPRAPVLQQGEHTTHYSVIDADGNRVAATMSINLMFGSGFMVDGTGVMLNDEMDDFSASVGSSNVYGLVGSVANAIAPGKRPLSSMTPTIVEGPRGLLVIGTPGGSRIPTMVLLGLLDWLRGHSAESIVAAPRFHHQYLPDAVQLEPDALSAEQRAELQRLGHTLAPLQERYGKMNIVGWERTSGQWFAASDPRGVGSGQVGVPAAR